MNLQTNTRVDRTQAIKDLIERWIEKNKAKEVIAKTTEPAAANKFPETTEEDYDSQAGEATG